MSVELLLEGRSSGWPNSRDVNVYNHLMGKFNWEFVADNFDKNETRPCRCERPPYHYPFRCHRFIGLFFDSKMVAEVLIFRDINLPLEKVIWKLKMYPQNSGNDVIDHDIILLWSTEKRVITGADILGRLLRGIATRKIRKP